MKEAGRDYLEVKIKRAKEKFGLDDDDLITFFAEQIIDCHNRILARRYIEPIIAQVYMGGE